MRTANEANKEKFLKAAVSELEEHGVSDFSIRRVAKKCGVSCAAPYKHFDGKSGLLLEVMRYIRKKWDDILRSTVETHKGEPVRQQIVAVCMAYITFLCTYTDYQTILNMNDRGFPPEMLEDKSKLTDTAQNMINEYCLSVNMPDDVRVRKQFVVLSIIYGAAIMINSGVLPFEIGTLEMIRRNIEREFELE